MANFGGTQGRCSRCETLPKRLVGPGRLHLWPPLGHTIGETYRHLRASGWVCETPEDRSVVVRLHEDRLSDLFAILSEALTNREMEYSRALFKPGAEGLSVSDIPRARSLKQLAALGGSGWLIDMLSEGRLTSYFQPIVKLDAPEEVYAQECLLRNKRRRGRNLPWPNLRSRQGQRHAVPG
jgi:hypothetical protein